MYRELSKQMEGVLASSRKILNPPKKEEGTYFLSRTSR